MVTLGERVSKLEDRMKQIEPTLSAVAEMSAMLRENTTKTNEMHDVFVAARGGFRVIQFLGTMAKPFLYACAVVAAVVVWAKTGQWTFP